MKENRNKEREQEKKEAIIPWIRRWIFDIKKNKNVEKQTSLHFMERKKIINSYFPILLLRKANSVKLITRLSITCLSGRWFNQIDIQILNLELSDS